MHPSFEQQCHLSCGCLWVQAPVCCSRRICSLAHVQPALLCFPGSACQMCTPSPRTEQAVNAVVIKGLTCCLHFLQHACRECHREPQSLDKQIPPCTKLSECSASKKADGRDSSCTPRVPFLFPFAAGWSTVHQSSLFWGKEGTKLKTQLFFFSHSFDQSTTQSTQTWGLNTAVHFQEHKITSAGSLRH